MCCWISVCNVGRLDKGKVLKEQGEGVGRRQEAEQDSKATNQTAVKDRCFSLLQNNTDCS